MIKCLLVDDEYFALALLEKHLSSEPDMEVVGKCKSPIAAIEYLNANEVDLLFLDIQMPLLSGVKLLRSISQKPTTILLPPTPNMHTKHLIWMPLITC
ncbi:MAG: response regulator [Saprospiraceae bacterium]